MLSLNGCINIITKYDDDWAHILKGCGCESLYHFENFVDG